jgi:hypothetical protein
LNGLNLRNNALKQAIPTTLGKQRFYYLLLNGNQLSGTIPDNLKFYSEEPWFDVRNNRISGVIPATIPVNAHGGNLDSKTCSFSNTQVCFLDGQAPTHCRQNLSACRAVEQPDASTNPTQSETQGSVGLDPTIIALIVVAIVAFWIAIVAYFAYKSIVVKSNDSTDPENGTPINEFSVSVVGSSQSTLRPASTLKRA